VYTRSGTSWTRQATLETAADVETEDSFSDFVGLDGDTAAVGAGGDAFGGPGRVRVYLRTATTWNEQAPLDASDGASNDAFGQQLAIAGDTLVIGARDSLDAGYVFTRSGATWTQEAKLHGSDEVNGDFGSAADIEGTTIAFGARFLGAGAAYVFQQVDLPAPFQEDKLLASNGASGDLFGSRIGIDGNTAIVGAYNKVDGSAYAFVRNGAIWSEQMELIGADVGQDIEPDIDDRYAFDVDVSGDTAVIGARDHEHDDLVVDLGCNDSCQGAVYVFVRNGTVWTEQAELTQGPSQIGVAVAIDGDTLVAGARDADSASGAGRGAAFVYVRSGTTWALQDTLEADPADNANNFGVSVDISGTTIIVGAEQPSTNIAYVFVRGAGNNWILEDRLEHGDERLEDSFPHFVGVDGDAAVVGTAGAVASGAGSARIYERNNSVWSQTGRVAASDASNLDTFGEYVAMDGDTIVVGADDADVVYVFNRLGNSWSQQARVVPVDVLGGEALGQSVAVSGDTAMGGAPFGTNGAAYAFRPVPEPGVGAALLAATFLLQRLDRRRYCATRGAR